MATKGLKGVADVSKRLKEATAEMQQGTMRGLIKASIVIRRDMDKTSPIIPVDTRNLQHSFYTVNTYGESERTTTSFKGADSDRMQAEHSAAVSESQGEAQKQPKSKPILIMGFSAFYALMVHEMEGAKFQRPGAGAKFFESALLRNRDKVKEILAKSAKEVLK